MNGVNKILLSAALALLGDCLSYGQTDNSVLALRSDVEFLSDPICGGRAVGTPEASGATWYILRRLRSAGLNPQIQTFDCNGVAGRNVIARIQKPGVRPWVVITAYYDGLGTRGDTMYPGADSNASGVAALLSIADSLSLSSFRKYNFILVALDGHNNDSAGADEFVRESLGQLSIRMVVDLDIIGSSLAPYKPYQKNYLIALGARPYRKTLDAIGQKYGLILYYDYYGSPDFTELFYNSMGDRPVFIKRGLPLVMFTSGITMNTNKVCDTAQTLDFEQTSRRVSIILDWLKTL